MAEDVGADALVGDSGPLTQTCKEQGHPVFGERSAGFRQKQVILARTTPVSQLLLIWPLFIHVVKQVAQAVLAERDAPFLGALALDGEDATFAVKIHEP